MGALDDLRRRAEVLIEALPYIRRFFGRVIVVKYGGAAMEDERLKREVMRDIALLRFVGMRVVLVHGGGKEISNWMAKVGKEPRFVKGLRVTDEETMEIVEMVLAGRVNKSLVALLNEQGARAVGLCGKDADLLLCERITEPDLGLVGRVVEVRREILDALMEREFVPVVATVGTDGRGGALNVNADHAAAEIAAALGAAKLVVMTDVRGIMRDPRDENTLISELTASEAEALIQEGVVERGMIPKVEACVRAVRGGVERAHIIDGRIPHALLMEIFTDEGIGTMIRAG